MNNTIYLRDHIKPDLLNALIFVSIIIKKMNMKLKPVFFCLTMFICIASVSSMAQVKGDYLVTFHYDTIPITILPNTFDGDLKCTINGEEKKYAPNAILYYRKGADNYEAALVNVTDHGKKHWSFLYREDYDKNARLVFFSKIIMAENDTSSLPYTVKHYCRRPWEKSGKIRSLNSIQDMIEVFADCPELTAFLKANPSTAYADAVAAYLDRKKCR